MPSHKKSDPVKNKKGENHAISLLKSIDDTAHHNRIVRNKIRSEFGLHHKYIMIITDYTRILAELRAELQGKVDTKVISF